MQKSNSPTGESRGQSQWQLWKRKINKNAESASGKPKASSSYAKMGSQSYVGVAAWRQNVIKDGAAYCVRWISMTPGIDCNSFSPDRTIPLLNLYLCGCSICHILIEGVVCQCKHQATSHTHTLYWRIGAAAAFDDVATIFDCLILN